MVSGVVKHFEELADHMNDLLPHQFQTALSICPQLAKLPERTITWIRDTAVLARQEEEAKELLGDLVFLIDFKKNLRKTPELSKDIITGLIKTLIYHKSKSYSFECEGPLAQFIGGIGEAQAKEYFGSEVVGRVSDKFGQTINIWKKALHHLYKDHAGGHTIAPDYYQEARGKRLPWIRHVLENSSEVYAEPKTGRHGLPNLVYQGTTFLGSPAPKYHQIFLVIVEFDRSKRLSFLTAFHIQDRQRLLKLLASWTPWKPPGSGARYVTSDKRS